MDTSGNGCIEGRSFCFADKPLQDGPGPRRLHESWRRLYPKRKVHFYAPLKCGDAEDRGEGTASLGERVGEVSPSRMKHFRKANSDQLVLAPVVGEDCIRSTS